MEIEYQVNIDDCFALNSHLTKTSPLMIQEIRKGQISMAISPLAGVAIVIICYEMSLLSALVLMGITGAIFSAPMFFLYPLIFKRAQNKMTIKLCASEKSQGILGLHKMRILSNGLEYSTDYTDSRITWNSINRIETADDHTFIFTDEIKAHIIPRNAVVTGDYTQFINSLTNLYQKNAG